MDSNDPKIQILDILLKQEFNEIYKLISTSEKLAIDFFSTIKNDLTFDEFTNWIGDELSLNFQSYSFADFFIQKYEEMDFTDTSSLLYLIRSIKPKIIEEPREKEFYREFFYKKLLEGDGHLFYDMLKSLYDNRRFIYTPQKVYLFFLQGDCNLYYEFLYPMFDQNIRVDITPEEFIADLEKHKEFYLEKHPKI